MPKRFLDTDMWRKPWFRKLSPVEKAAWIYLLTHCDNVGVWVPDMEGAEFYIGDTLDWTSFVSKVNGNIEILANGKWFLVDFVHFQHPDLLGGSKSNACQSYYLLLEKHNLLERFEGLSKPRASQGLAPKAQVKEEVKERKKKRGDWGEKKKHGDVVMLTDKDYQKLCVSFGKRETDTMLDVVDNYCKANGKTYKDYAAAARNFFRRDGVLPDLNNYKICEQGHKYKGEVCEQCI